MTWNEFWSAHKKGNYTPVFNTFLDSQIADSRLPLTTRVLAWALRNSWGRFSDAAVSAEGVRQGQVDCARELRVLDKVGEPDRRRIGPVFQELERTNLIRFDGREILPVDNPLGVFAESSPQVAPQSDISDEDYQETVSFFLENVWKVKNPKAYAEYQRAEREYKALRMQLVVEYKAHRGMSERGPTNSSGSRNEGRQAVGMRADNASERGATNSGPSFNRTENLKVSPSSSFSVIREAVQKYAPEPDDDALTQMVHSCRKECEDCTEDEIAYFVHVKARLITGRVTNPLGFLLAAVPKCFAVDSIRSHRARLQLQEEPAVSSPIASLEELIRELPDHPDAEIWREELAALQRKPAASEPNAQAQKAGQR